MSKRLAFAIHHLNLWGGHDRSTLEVIRRLSQKFDLEVHAYSVEDPKKSQWGNYSFSAIHPHFRRPAFLLLTVFYVFTFWKLYLKPKLLGQSRPLVHATGACSLVSDVIQVQFVQTAWNEQKKKSQKPLGMFQHRSWKSFIKFLVRRFYHWVLLKYNLYVEKKVFRKDKVYIAIAQGVADELKKYFGIEKNVHVIHHGVDSTLFHPVTPETQEERSQIRKKYHILDEQLLAIFVGEYERKGLSVTLHALSQLDFEQRKKIRLLAVGNGDQNYYRAMSTKLGVSENVILLDHQKRIESFFRAADLFVLPTLYEPFGLVTLEAMSSGLPPIVSKNTGASELISHGISGILLDDPTKPQEVTDGFKRLIENRELLQSMSQEARRVALQRTWDQVALEYQKVLEPLLSKVSE